MDWNSLKIFLSIVRCGSLSGAAKQLGVNHSTIFRRLNIFEEEMGGRLFKRINNRYELTSMGQEVLMHAEDIEHSFATLDRYIVGKDIQPKGTVKITAPNNIAYQYLPQYITEFNQDYPDINIEILVSNQALNMNNRQADIAIRATPHPPENLVGRQVATIDWHIYASPAYTNKFGLPKDISALSEHQFIGATGSLSHLPAFTWLDKHLSQQVITRCDDLTAMSYFAETGQGLALLPADQKRPEITQLLRLPGNETSNLWLLTHPDLRNVTRIKLVMQHLTKAFSQAQFG